MAFFKFRSRGPQGNDGRSASLASPPAESIEAIRRGARHRLLGAAVLVLVGVIGFPLLFDTQPRPVSVDIPIEIPDRSKVKPLTVPTVPAPVSVVPGATPPTAAADENSSEAKTSASAKANASASTRSNAASSSSGMITEAADGSEISASKQVTTAPEPKPEAKPKSEVKVEAKAKPESQSEVRIEPRPEPKSEPKPKPTEAKAALSEDGARARALLEGKVVNSAPATQSKPAAAAEETSRFVIQVGAFADASKAREVRQKLENAGLKTYISVTKTAEGERTRVRVGPFATRADADRAASRVKSLSLTASVLTL